MAWTVKILDKKIDSMECPYIWRSPMEQICTFVNTNHNNESFLCKDRKNCPIVINDDLED